MLLNALFVSVLSATVANAHIAAWANGMYCKNGTSGTLNENAAEIINPLYNLPKSQWWMHHVNNCDQFPPAAGEFLELPAGGQFTVQMSANRATTTFSYNGKFVSDWVDGKTYPDDYNVPTCITTPNMHTQNQSMAAGTAFAISYVSDIKQVTPENLAVFSVRYHTPWKRLTTYDVPAALPACPEGGCICAWGWIPNGCGEPNMYMVPYKCKVTGAKSTTPVATPKPAVWCEGKSGECTKGAKQMLFWNQAEGNNIEVDGYDLSGGHKSPAYNSKCGFSDGAQNDIFTGAATGGNQEAVHSSSSTAAANPTTVVAPPASSPVKSSTTVVTPATSSPASVPAASSPAQQGSTPTTTTVAGSKPSHHSRPGHCHKKGNGTRSLRRRQAVSRHHRRSRLTSH